MRQPAAEGLRQPAGMTWEEQQHRKRGGSRPDDGSKLHSLVSDDRRRMCGTEMGMAFRGSVCLLI